MNFKPILFSTEMVRAILGYRKFQTRRKMKVTLCGAKKHDVQVETDDKEWIKQFADKCPYGKVGDVLWVRETIIANKHNEAIYTADHSHVYLNNEPRLYDSIDISFFTEKRQYVPSIHMPKAACRIFLQIKSITVERLQTISEQDAIAEGVFEYEYDGTYKNYFKKKGFRSQDGVECLTAKASFQSLWSSINGLDSWQANPWVWVIEFEQIKKPANF